MRYQRSCDTSYYTKIKSWGEEVIGQTPPISLEGEGSCRGSHDISETLIYWNTRSKSETSTNHQLKGCWSMRRTKKGWFEAYKNTHNRSLPKTSRVVTILFRKLKLWLCSTLFCSLQRSVNPDHTEFLHHIGRFGSIFIWYSLGTGISRFTDSGRKSQQTPAKWTVKKSIKKIRNSPKVKA